MIDRKHIGLHPIDGGERCARVRVEMRDRCDELKIRGEALVALRHD